MGLYFALLRRKKNVAVVILLLKCVYCNMLIYKYMINIVEEKVMIIEKKFVCMKKK